MFAIFSINIFNRSIYVLIFNIFSNEYWILRATEDLKNSILEGFFGEMGVYRKSYNAVLLRYISMFYCGKFQVSN